MSGSLPIWKQMSRGAQRLAHVSCLGRCILRRAVPEIQPVDHAPSAGARRSRCRLRIASGVRIEAVLAAVPASGPMACGVWFFSASASLSLQVVYSAVLPPMRNTPCGRELPEKRDEAGVFGGEEIGMAELRRLVAQPCEVARHRCQRLAEIDREA